MAEYLHPGVYIEEVSSGVRPLEGVGTSTAGFVGKTLKGEPNKALFITSWAQFVRTFGDLSPDSYLPYAVANFFENGGKRCYVVRVLNAVSARRSEVTLPDRESSPRSTLRISAKGGGKWGDSLGIRIESSTNDPTHEFRIVVLHEGREQERFDNLSVDPASQGYVVTEVNGNSDFIQVEDLEAYDVNAVARAASAALGATEDFGAGVNLVLTEPDGTAHTASLIGILSRDDVLANVQSAFAPAGVNASLDDGNRLVIAANDPGFDQYFSLSGASGPLAGMSGFYQGAGASIGATQKSAVATGGTFDMTGANDLDISVNGSVISITLTNAVLDLDTLLGEINAAISAGNAAGVVSALREGDRLVVRTQNRGANNASLSISGGADGVLQFRRFDRGGSSGDTVVGQGSSEAAFVQSDPGPFSFTDGATLSFITNNGTLGADVTTTVTFSNTAIPNLQQVSAAQVASAINTAAAAVAGGPHVAAVVENNRVIVRQSRRGNFFRLRVSDGTHSPNLRLNFSTQQQTGYTGGTPSPDHRPALAIGASGVNEPYPLALGSDGNPVTAFDYIGTADAKTGLHALDDVDDVNFVAVPGQTSSQVVGGAAAYCATRKDCVFIADSPEPLGSQVTDPIHVRDFVQNQLAFKTSYAALYYPWVEVADPVGAGRNPRRLIPPSGMVAGMYARIDNTRGVWKAPAGTEANVRGALALEYSMADAEQDILNPIGVNCLRRFSASGIVIWGARTLGTQSDPEWRYLPVRRYAIYIEQSILRGTQWAVFEPNDAPLWDTLTANITDFMMGEFHRGALAGRTPDEAFRVKCDADLNPPFEVNAGRVNVEIRFAPLKPAEFVIIRISQKSLRPEN
jgi:phage tail sheath protein FI